MVAGATPSSTIERTCVAVAAQVLQLDARAVGAAPEVHLVVAQGRADVVDILHRDGGDVLARVGVELLQALRHQVHGQRVLEERLQRRVVVLVAIQRMRGAGAALVDEDHVALVVQVREERHHLGGERHRALPRSAREDEDRVRLVGAHARRDDGDVDVDAPPLLRRAVFPYQEASRTRAAASTPGRRQDSSASVRRGASATGLQAADARHATAQSRRRFIELILRGARRSITVGRYHSPVDIPNFPKRDPDSAEFWDLRYGARFAPWDAGRVPARLAAFAAAWQGPRKALVPGCGSAHDVAFLAAAGWDVLGIDFSDGALAAARAVLGPHAARVRARRFLRAARRGALRPSCTSAPSCARCRDACGATGDGASRPSSRRAACSPGFFYFDAGERGPPFPLHAQAELDALLADEFERIEDAAVEDSIPVFAGKERWQVWLRR